MEAMAVALPVFLSDIPSHRELNVEPTSRSGLELLPEKVDSWNDALQAFWRLDAEQRVLKGKRSRAIVEENFSLQEMHAAYDEVYQKVLDE
jgi:glycosyltransferase involved in cell wall biosynthesis